MIKLNDKKVLGAMYGVAIGDALGGPLEFMDAEHIKLRHGEVREMIGGGWLNLQKGEITDDTQMTLCVAEGIVKSPNDPIFSVGVNMIDWNNSNPKDIGITCSRVINNVSRIDSLKSEDWFKISERYHIVSNGQSAGNGSLMRMVYPALFYSQDECVDIAVKLGKMTHWHEHSTLAITCYTKAIAEFIRTPYETETSYLKERLEFHMQDIRALETDDLQPTGYVIDSLLCALNSIRDTTSFEDAVVKAVNLGGDADTIGAITGSLAGAIYSYNEIPQRWLECLNVDINTKLKELSNIVL